MDAFQADAVQPNAFQVGKADAGAPVGTTYGGGLHHVQCGFMGANGTGIPQTLHTIDMGISA